MSYMTFAEKKEQAAKLLETAADQLDVTGWCRGTLVDEQGRTCLLGALRGAEKDLAPSNRRPVRYLAEDVVLDLLRERGQAFSIAIWNDDQKDKRKVQRVLRAAARRLRKALA